VFISWSGAASKEAELALRDSIPAILGYAHPWMSSEDLQKGVGWGPQLAKELEDTHCGIICLTRDNLAAPWLNFEAGALSKAVAQAQVHPLLIGFRASELAGPLSQFQATEFDQVDVKRLIQSINASAPQSLPADRLDMTFRAVWPSLEQRIRAAAARSGVAPATTAGGANQPSRTAALTDEDVSALQAMVDAGDIPPIHLASAIQLDPERAKYILEKLEGLGLLDALHNYVTGTTWQLSRDGRAELVNRGLL